MRTLNSREVTEVSGGDWHLDFNFIIISGGFTGDETIQEVAGAVYGGAVDAVADFFTWWDPAGYYNSGCSGGGGGW